MSHLNSMIVNYDVKEEWKNITYIINQAALGKAAKVKWMKEIG